MKATMNPIAREELIVELDRLVRYAPVMGTLYMTVRQTPHMLIVTLQDDVISLAYPHARRFDILGSYRFASFCKTRGFKVQKEWWANVRVSRALIGNVASDAAQTIGECFCSIYPVSGPFGLHLRGMGWQPSEN